MIKPTFSHKKTSYNDINVMYCLYYIKQCIQINNNKKGYSINCTSFYISMLYITLMNVMFIISNIKNFKKVLTLT